MTNPAIQTIAAAATLESEAADLVKLAEKKERQADYLEHGTRGGSAPQTALRKDAAIFREEAKAKRAKAERMRKAAQS
jgi:hypothetical protein